MSEYFILCHLSNMTSSPSSLQFFLSCSFSAQPATIYLSAAFCELHCFLLLCREICNKNRHISRSSIPDYHLLLLKTNGESERILLRKDLVDNLSLVLVLHVVVNISSDLLIMSFSPLPLLHRSSVLSIARSPALCLFFSKSSFTTPTNSSMQVRAYSSHQVFVFGCIRNSLVIAYKDLQICFIVGHNTL